MKKGKLLGALTLSLASLACMGNVSAAASCAANEDKYTNYYLFLDYGARGGETKYGEYGYLDASGNLKTALSSHLTSAKKYNNIKDIEGAHIIQYNQVKITAGSKSTVDNSEVTWSATDFWNKWNTTQRSANVKGVYEDSSNNTNYFLHFDKYWKEYASEDDTLGKEHESADFKIYEKLDSNAFTLDDLATKATLIPGETQLDLPSALGTNPISSADTVVWNIRRYYRQADFTSSLVGVKLNPSAGDAAWSYLFSPAAFYVDYCVPKAGSVTTDKKIEYDGNSTDAKNVPATTTFTEECAKVASTVPTREGYTFLGWNTDKAATSGDSTYWTSADGGKNYCGNSIKLYAIWKKKSSTDPVMTPFSVTYEAGPGAVDAPKKQTSDGTTCIAISGQGNMKQTGHSFLGWSRNSKAIEADSAYAPGKKYCGEEGDITLYAVWKSNTGVSSTSNCTASNGNVCYVAAN